MGQNLLVSTQISAPSAPRSLAVLSLSLLAAFAQVLALHSAHGYHIPGSESSYILANHGWLIPSSMPWCFLAWLCDSLSSWRDVKVHWEWGWGQNYAIFWHKTEGSPVSFTSLACQFCVVSGKCFPYLWEGERFFSYSPTCLHHSHNHTHLTGASGRFLSVKPAFPQYKPLFE